MASRKYSRQREMIRDNLRGRTDHPTAEAVYEDLRLQDPHISLWTVYRNLSLLADMGEIERIGAVPGADHFDGNMTEHDHFVCRTCGGIQDIAPADHRSLERGSAPHVSGQITGSSITFFGVCRQCLAARR